VEGAARGGRTPGTSRLQAIALAGPAGSLEGLLQEHDAQKHAITAVVLHPHPLYGGTLHNKVVHRLASVLHGMGAAVLRINFRGVGASEGSHDRGEGELDDARAAWTWMRTRYPDARRWLGGFSFGSWVAARLAASEPDVERLILVAPPVATSDFSRMRTTHVPTLVIQGSRDDQAPSEALEGEFPHWAEPKQLIVVEGATHFFDKQLGALADALHQGLAGPARGGTSQVT
jgi:alpha/beta superfamily hydrolase